MQSLVVFVQDCNYKETRSTSHATISSVVKIISAPVP